MKETQNDRVSFSMGRKLSLDHYESVDIHCSYSTDVQKEALGETVEMAMQRCMSVVKKTLGAQEKKIIERRDGNAASQDV
jgi:hypothetical protein